MPPQQTAAPVKYGYISLWANQTRRNDNDTTAYGTVKLKVDELEALLKTAKAEGTEMVALRVSLWTNDNKQNFDNPATYTGSLTEPKQRNDAKKNEAAGKLL